MLKDYTMPMCLSMLNILLFAPLSYSFDCTSFSTPNTIPSLPRIPIAVLKHKCMFVPVAHLTYNITLEIGMQMKSIGQKVSKHATNINK